MIKRKSPYPNWVDKHRKPGTEIRKFGEKFYIYEVSSYYDKVKKKGRKKTGKFWVPSQKRKVSWNHKR
jgi:hypothetical protein